MADDLSGAALPLLLRRLDKQDQMLDQILKEAKVTNGRITALEQRNNVDDARRQLREETRRRWFRRVEFVVPALLSALMVVVMVLNVVHPWG